MKKLFYLIVLILILGLALTGCTLLSNVGQVPTTEQSGITYLTKGFPSNLVGLWNFDEGDGLTAYDSSGNSNDGTINGATYYPDQWGGQALSFDGDTTTLDYISVEDSDLLDMTVNNELTIEAWVCTTDPSKNQQIVDKGEHAFLSAYMLMIYGGNLYGRVNKNNATACIYAYPNDGEWHHVAYTFKSGEQKLYIDGSNVVSNMGSATIAANEQPLFIGNGVARLSVYEWKGTIDEVRIYDCALSPDTIADHAEGIYGFNGLMDPYAPPEQKTFKFGRTIPLKWQYTDFDGNVVDSVDADPVVEYQFADGGGGGGDLELTDDPGLSGLRYKSDSKTWQFNWQTKDLEYGAGTYKIWITSIQTGQVNGPFLIELL